MTAVAWCVVVIGALVAATIVALLRHANARPRTVWYEGVA